MGSRLSIVNHLVELRGGGVRAESAGVGRGSASILTIPRTLVTASPAVIRSHGDLSRSATTFLGKAILVVDDEADARELLRVALENIVASVVTATSAEQARELIVGSRVDLIISDLSMPTRDEYALIRHIRAILGDVPVNSPYCS